MCGGRGTRLEAETEKPLFEVGGRPMVDRVAESLAESRIERVFAVVTPAVPETRKHLEVSIISTPGAGYVADLDKALEDDRVEPPVLTIVADLPLVAAEHVDDLLDRQDRGSLAMCVPVTLKEVLGVSLGETMEPDGELAPTGLNVVGVAAESDRPVISYDVRLAINVNRVEDAVLAEAFL